MIRNFKACLFAGACALPLFAIPAAAQDGAQEEPADATQPNSNIILVTANKREENMQEVPISITAFSQEELDRRGVVGLDGVQESTPNLNFSVQSAGQNVARVTLRGVGTETLVGAGDPGVALHIDGVYVGRNSAAVGDIFDVQRVEVLRGPQGTLYGRNATGGSINIITQQPQPYVEGYADVTYGNYDALRIRGVVNVPLSDSVASRVSVMADSRDGYIENLWPTGRDSADKKSFSGRAQLLWETGGGDELLLRGYFMRRVGAGPGSRFRGNDINTANGYPASDLIGVRPNGAPVLADAYGLGLNELGGPILSRPDGFYEVRKDANEFVELAIKGIDLQGDFALNDSVLLRTVTSYQTNDNEILVDSDGSELFLQTRQRDSSAEQFSQEFNLISQTDSPFQWILGAYYYHESLTEDFDTRSPGGKVPLDTPLPPGSIPGGSGTFQSRSIAAQADSYALFGQATYEVSDYLTLTAGLRHSWDEKAQQRSGGGVIDLVTGVRRGGGGAIGSFPDDQGEASFAEWSYRLAANLEIAPDHYLFASYSRGYKTGGFDFNGGRVDANLNQVPYNPEFVTAYEVGSKNQFWDRRVTFNLTSFYYDYTDLQVFRLTGDGPVTDNAAKSTIWGIEAETRIEPTDGLTLEATVGYLDATYDNYVIERPAPASFAGNTLNYSPEWTVYLAAQYVAPIGENELTARLDYSWRSETFFDRANTDLDRQEPYGLVNARLRYDADSWYVAVFGRNLTGEEYYTGQLINPPFNCGCRTVNLGNPRTYGVTFGVNY